MSLGLDSTPGHTAGASVDSELIPLAPLALAEIPAQLEPVGRQDQSAAPAEVGTEAGEACSMATGRPAMTKPVNINTAATSSPRYR